MHGQENNHKRAVRVLCWKALSGLYVGPNLRYVPNIRLILNKLATITWDSWHEVVPTLLVYQKKKELHELAVRLRAWEIFLPIYVY